MAVYSEAKKDQQSDLNCHQLHPDQLHPGAAK